MEKRRCANPDCGKIFEHQAYWIDQRYCKDRGKTAKKSCRIAHELALRREARRHKRKELGELEFRKGLRTNSR